MRRAGVIAQIGMMPAAPQPIALASRFIAKEVQLRGCFRFNNEIDEAIALLAANSNFASRISHVLPAADAQQAFAIAKDAEVSARY